MTPKEKAEELIKRYYRDSDLLVEDLSWIQAKECVLIAVDEIINYLTTSPDVQTSLNAVDYWQEVKEEIKKL
jgi:hypothetical protein